MRYILFDFCSNFLVSISFLINIGKEMSLPGFRTHVPPISIDLISDLMQNGKITDFDNNCEYQLFFKTHFPSYLIVNSNATTLLMYKITKSSNSFLLP